MEAIRIGYFCTVLPSYVLKEIREEFKFLVSFFFLIIVERILSLAYSIYHSEITLSSSPLQVFRS